MTQTTERPVRPSAGGGGRRRLGQRIATYYKQVIGELRKVIWPTRRELVTYTIVSIVFVTVMVLIVFLFDLGFSKLVLAVFG